MIHRSRRPPTTAEVFAALSLAISILVSLGLTATPARAAESGDPDRGPDLRIPGMPPIPLPPGPRVFPDQRSGDDAATDDTGSSEDPGSSEDLARRRDIYRDFGAGMGAPRGLPGGRFGAHDGRRAATPAKPQTPAERDAAIRKAMAPKPPLAQARRRTLDELYTKLAAASDEDEAKGLATLIGDIWMRSGSDTASLLMQRAVQAIEGKNYPLAEQLLGRIIALQPNWAEAWNKRASVRYFSGDLDGSMADVEHVLKLEPKHFGALEGMATMLQRTGLHKRALEIYRRALAIYPHQPAVEKIVDKLTLDVEGQGI